MFGKNKNKKGSMVSNRLQVLNSVLGSGRDGKDNRKVRGRKVPPTEEDERLAEAMGDKQWEEELKL